VAEVAEAKTLAESPAEADQAEAAAETGSGASFMLVLVGIAAAGGAYYHRSRPRIVSLDDALISHEGYSNVLDQYG
jgi:hypothetical protein